MSSAITTIAWLAAYIAVMIAVRSSVRVARDPLGAVAAMPKWWHSSLSRATIIVRLLASYLVPACFTATDFNDYRRHEIHAETGLIVSIETPTSGCTNAFGTVRCPGPNSGTTRTQTWAVHRGLNEASLICS
jgi:hypothetical protein